MHAYQNQAISRQTKELIEILLLTKFSLAEIAQITGISATWLNSYANLESEAYSLMG
jgi:phage portal protein BeeE